MIDLWHDTDSRTFDARLRYYALDDDSSPAPDRARAIRHDKRGSLRWRGFAGRCVGGVALLALVISALYGVPDAWVGMWVAIALITVLPVVAAARETVLDRLAPRAGLVDRQRRGGSVDPSASPLVNSDRLGGSVTDHNRTEPALPERAYQH